MKQIIMTLALMCTLSAFSATTYLVQLGTVGAATWRTAGINETLVNLSTASAGSTFISLNDWLRTTTFVVDDQVWIAKGTYTISSTLWTGPGSTILLSVYGGFAGSETTISERIKGTASWDFTNQTTIDGHSLGNTFIKSASSAGCTILLNGLTFTAFSTKSPIYSYSGTTVQNCQFLSNSINGINHYNNTGYGSASCSNSYFYNNTGGGIYCFTKTTYTIDGCVFDTNTATGINGGGGVSFNGFGRFTIINSIFKNNICSTIGSGVVMSGAKGSMYNCLIFGNTGSPAVHLALGASMYNCTVVNNIAGGVNLAEVSASKIYNSVFWGTDSNSGQIISVTANNLSDIRNSAYNSISVNYTGTTVSCITLPLTNTSGTNAPNFTDPTNNIWTLSTGSSLLDKGFNLSDPSISIPYNKDMIGISRPTDAFDIGTYEAVTSGSLNASTLNTTIGDISIIGNGTLLNIDTNKNFQSIYIAPRARLTLGSGNTLTTSGITLQSDATGTATFVDNNVSTLPTIIATVHQSIPATDRNWYVSVPVSDLLDGSITLSGSKIIKRNEAQVKWDDFTGTLLPGVGYIAVASTSSGTTSWNLSGNLNSGNIDVDLTCSGSSYTGFNLVGNPYPSYLNWEQVLTLNAGNATLVQPTIWYRTAVWNTNTLKYDYSFPTYNSVGRVSVPTTASGYIPPMQAFWVKANTAGTLAFTNSMRSHGEGSTNILKVKSSLQSAQQLLRLEVSNGTNNDEAVIYFNPNAQNGFDAYDSPKMTDTIQYIPRIYTVAGAENLVINGLNSISYDTEMPLIFTPGTSMSFSLKASEISNFVSGTQILLKDNGTGAITDLTNGNVYNFDNSVSASGRFSIIFKAAGVPTDMNQTNGENSENATISIFRNTNNHISVNLKDLSSNAKIAIYNSLGQKLVEKRITKNLTPIDIEFESGLYLVTVENGKGLKTQKVILK